MCIAILQKADTPALEDAVLDRCHRCHDDGCGMMYVSEKYGLQDFRTMDIEEFKTQYKKIHDKYSDNPIAVHFRTGTSGDMNVSNCHPFVVNEDMMLMHNGVMSNMDAKIGDKNYGLSDTRVFIEKVGKYLPDITTSGVLQEMLDEYIGWGNKLIVMNNEGEYYIANEMSGDWEGDVWYSNKSWKSYSNSGSNFGIHSTYDVKVPCVMCSNLIEKREVIKLDTISYTKYLCKFCFKGNQSMTLAELDAKIALDKWV